MNINNNNNNLINLQYIENQTDEICLEAVKQSYWAPLIKKASKK